MLNRILSTILGLIGATIGGILGYFLFFWIAKQGFYGLMIPGALLGLGCSLLAQHPSALRGVVCGLAALGLGVFTEWRFGPFQKDQSLGFFVSHLSDLKTITLVMIAVGALIAFWLGKDASPIFGSVESREAKPRSPSNTE